MSRSAKKVSGITLVEILAVITIIGVMAGLALPSYFGAVEEARANEARANLQVIYAAERVYRLNRGVFWDSLATPVTPAIINAPPSLPPALPSAGGLDTDIAIQFYNITSVTLDAGRGFVALVTRNAVQGGNGTRAYDIDQNGIVNQTSD